MKKFILMFVLFIIPYISFSQWAQLGIDIDGDEGDRFGRSVSLNAAGDTMIVGAEASEVNGELSGLAQVFDFNGTSWTQRGENINGAVFNNQFGGTVTIDEEGNTIAITSTFGLNTMGFRAGLVNIFDWDGDSWVQRGQTIEGDGDTSPVDDLDFFGKSTSFSSDTNTIAIGGPSNREFGVNAGHVRVFDWNGASWEQRGEDLTRGVDEDGFGFAVRLSANGNILVVGAPGSDRFSPNTNGIVRSYEWGGTAWEQIGTDIEGLVSGDSFGKNLDLNKDGSVLAVGAPDTDVTGGNLTCTARVFEWDGTDWTQRGVTLTGERDSDTFGGSISLSDNGSILAVSAPSFSGNGNTYIYQWDGVEHVQQGDTIIGEAPSDLSGASISLNATGNTIAIGAYGNDANGPSSGHVRVFQNALLNTTSQNILELNYFPNPVNEVLHIRASEVIKSTTVYNLLGQELFFSNRNSNEYSINLSGLNSGTYLVKVETDNSSQILKISKK